MFVLAQKARSLRCQAYWLHLANSLEIVNTSDRNTGLPVTVIVYEDVIVKDVKTIGCITVEVTTPVVAACTIGISGSSSTTAFVAISPAAAGKIDRSSYS